MGPARAGARARACAQRSRASAPSRHACAIGASATPGRRARSGILQEQELRGGLFGPQHLGSDLF
eukprot:2129378-Pyramimonas_sp.AAC.1